MILGYQEQKEILEKYNLKTPTSFFIENKEQVSLAVEKIGYPLVMKISSRKHLHRTEVGGVVKDIKSKEEAEEAFITLSKVGDIDGIIAEEQIKGVEFIVGIKNDSSFGKGLMLGSGGVMVEVFNDVSFRVLPIKSEDATEMINEIKGRKFLEGFRGNEEVDKKIIVDFLVSVSFLAEEEKCAEVDFNPVIINNKGAFVCDVKIIV
ncbi:MAG: acetate--CoA ligase family protein [Patescibacteria group bacterium]|jgi:acyl-CoA synthetase (NDP forming)|nr:acetate--CoA ligase family protein [Patescibacteria group bacterium]